MHALQDFIHKSIWKQIPKLFFYPIWTLNQGSRTLNCTTLQIFMMIEFQKIKVTQLNSIFVIVSLYTVLCHRDVIIASKFSLTLIAFIFKPSWRKLVPLWIYAHKCTCVMPTCMDERHETCANMYIYVFSDHKRLDELPLI